MLPQVVLTSDIKWDPTILDHSWGDTSDEWHANGADPSGPTLFDPTGNYLHQPEDFPCPPWLANLANLSGDDGLDDATTQVLLANTLKYQLPTLHRLK